MADELIDIVVQAAADVAIDQAAKRRRWVRIVRGIWSLAFLAFIVFLVWMTVTHS